MPKVKTRKSAQKRFRITKQGKILRKKTGQDHFNIKESGRKTRKKRGRANLAKADKKHARRMLPYG